MAANNNNNNSLEPLVNNNFLSNSLLNSSLEYAFSFLAKSETTESNGIFSEFLAVPALVICLFKFPPPPPKIWTLIYRGWLKFKFSSFA